MSITVSILLTVIIIITCIPSIIFVIIRLIKPLKKYTESKKCKHDWFILEKIDAEELHNKLKKSISTNYKNNDFGQFVEDKYTYWSNIRCDTFGKNKKLNILYMFSKYPSIIRNRLDGKLSGDLHNKICSKCEKKEFEIYDLIETYKKVIAKYLKIKNKKEMEEHIKNEKKKEFENSIVNILEYKKCDFDNLEIIDKTIKDLKNSTKNYELNKAIYRNEKRLNKLDEIQKRILSEENKKLKDRLHQLETLSGMYSIKPQFPKLKGDN